MLTSHNCDQTLRGKNAPALVLPRVGGKLFDLQASHCAYYTLLIFKSGLDSAECSIYLSKLDLLMGSWLLKSLRIVVVSNQNEQDATQQAAQRVLKNIEIVYDMTAQQAATWRILNEAEVSSNSTTIVHPVAYLLNHELVVMKRYELTGRKCKLPKLESLRNMLNYMSLRASRQLALQQRTMPA